MISLKNLIIKILHKEVQFWKSNILIRKNLIIQHLPIKERVKKNRN